MNPFVVAVVVAAAVAVMAVVVAVVVVEAVTEVAVAEEVVTDTEVMVVADTVVDIGAEVMAVVVGADGVGVAGGPLLDGLIAETSPVLIIFSKSLNDHPFSQ
jgi:hypothetical protein